MQALKRNRMGGTAAVVLAALAWAGAATEISADPRSPSLRPAPRSSNVEMRTLLQYRESAWIRPTAVVLHSEQAWLDWNREAVTSGIGIGMENLPAVDWDKEAVLVVALGEDMNRALSLSLMNPRKAGSMTELTMEVKADGQMGPSNPAHVVALSKKAARNIRLVPGQGSAPVAGMPAYAPLYGTAAPDDDPPSTIAVGQDISSDIDPAQPSRSWGALKVLYR